jgi:hypothetical protein
MAENEPLDIVDEEVEHIFSNLISFNTNPEEVCMGLGIRDVKEPNVVYIQKYLHLTIPHFLRFSEAINKQVEMLVEKGIITREPEQ